MTVRRYFEAVERAATADDVAQGRIPRYHVVSEVAGLVWSGDDAQRAEDIALMTAVNTGRTVYLQDGTTR